MGFISIHIQSLSRKPGKEDRGPQPNIAKDARATDFNHKWNKNWQIAHDSYLLIIYYHRNQQFDKMYLYVTKGHHCILMSEIVSQFINTTKEVDSRLMHLTDTQVYDAL